MIKDQIKAVGIDFGTTFSLVAAVDENQSIQFVSMDNDSLFLPTTAVYRDEALVHVGASHHDEHTDGDIYTSFKRHMHEPHQPIYGCKTPTPFRLAIDVLRALKSKAEIFFGQDLSQTVITVPAYFDDTARHAIREAAFLAGWRVLRLINEPTAAACAYGFDQKVNGTYLVYDLGGGTFDVSILEFASGVFQVRSTCGDVHLGGDDVDEAIMLRDHVSRSEARRLKEQGAVQNLDVLIQPLIDRTIELCKQALTDSKIDTDELLGIILVGGSSRLPTVCEKLAYTFQKPIFNKLNPDTLVVQGAARQAHALTHPNSDVLLLDVSPLSLGVETLGGLVDIIIPRNTLLPTAMAQDFTTGIDNQTAILFHVVQGEHLYADQCRSLARFELKGLNPETAGSVRVRVTFEVDVDGVLNVYAVDLKTEAARAVHVEPTYGLTQEAFYELAKGADERPRLEALDQAGQTIDYIKKALVEDGDLLDNIERSILQSEVDKLEYERESLCLDDLMMRHAHLSRMAQPLIEKRLERHLINRNVS